MLQRQVCRLGLPLLLSVAFCSVAQGTRARGASPAATTDPGAGSKHAKAPKKTSTPAPPHAGDDAGASGAPKGEDEKNRTVYAFGLPTADGKNLPLSSFKGKVLLVVNLGRQSSYAAQLPALEKLSDTFKDKGLIVIGVPSNDFGNAEPGTPAEVAKFYADAKVNFPVMQVSSLTGVHELPLFEYLAKNKAVENDGLHWNYTKFLVDRNGKVVVCFSPEVAPDSLAMMATVQEVLDGTWKPKKPEGKDKPSDEDDDE